METYPKLKIFRQDEDTGPSMKIVPTVKRCLGERAIIISIDDDSAYNKSQIFTLLHALEIANYECVVGFRGQSDRGMFSFGEHGVQVKSQQLLPKLKEYFPNVEPVDIIEGFGMIAYLSDLVDVQAIETASKTSKECFRSDDLTISYALEKRGVPKFALNHVNPFPGVQQLSSGFEADALS